MIEDKVNKYKERAELLKVLAHPVRLCIINGLIENGECNVSYMQSCLNTPQSTVSQHLQKLRAAGIVKDRRSGLEVYYQVCNEEVIEIVHILMNNKK